MEAFYSESISINQAQWSEADTDLRFMANDQAVYNDLYGNLPPFQRRHFSFNRIQSIVNVIDGYQRRNRKSTIVVPVENGDAETADQFTKVMMWINNTENILPVISDAFRDSLITGMSLLQVWMDYRTDPVSGNVKVDKCSYNSFLIDPFFRKADLSDCTGLWKRSFLTKREIISLLPNMAEEILGLQGNESGTGRDGKFQYMPESYGYSYKNLLTYDEYWYRDYRTQKMLVDSQTGETMEWRSNNEEGLKQFLKLYPSITVAEQEVATVNLGIVVQGKVMYHGPNPMGIDSYPFIPVFAYYYPQMPYWPNRVQGVVRSLRDSQFLYNRRKIIELDILESQINSGWKYKENALVNPKDVYLTGQGRGLALKEEAQMTDVEQIQPPQVPPSMIELSRILADEIKQISGVNEELLGSATDEKAGILSMLRQGAGLTTLQCLFDNLDNSQKLLGKIIIDLIQVNFTPGKIKKILEGDEPTPQFYNKAFGKYNAVVEEGLNTTTQKQMMFAQLLQLRQTGVPITDQDLLEASTFQGKKKIIENMMQAQQQQTESATAAVQIQQELQQAQIQLAQSTSRANDGLALERQSRVEENHALALSRVQEAHKQEELALLNKVKILKELDELDLSHIQRLINMANSLKLEERNNIQTSFEANTNPQNGSESIRG